MLLRNEMPSSGCNSTGWGLPYDNKIKSKSKTRKKWRNPKEEERSPSQTLLGEEGPD